MKTGITPPSVAEICKNTGKTSEEVNAFIAMLRRAMEPLSQRFNVSEGGVTRCYTVERKGLGLLTTKYGEFWQYSFVIDDQWEKYSVIVKANLDTNSFAPEFRNDQLVMRIDSGCETGQLFGDLTCECGEQLHLALKTLSGLGEGMVIHIPRQDGRGMGLSFKLATLWAQEGLKLDTVESASLLAPGSIIDVRTYAGVICILKFFAVPTTRAINLATNNPDKMQVFAENGYTVADSTPVVIPPTAHTKAHLSAKQKHLGHRCLFCDPALNPPVN